MRLHNTLTRRIERFRPRPGQPVAIYVCGITPYDTTHLGHAFTYVVFDVLVRHLATVHRWPVRYVQNLTDIDDDVLRRAAATGQDWRTMGLEWTHRFTSDMAKLNVRPPAAFPAATAFVPAMHEIIQALVGAGRGYASGGSVYYRTGDDPRFGEIARLSREQMLEVANERGNVADDPFKEDPLDFVLWQAAKIGEPAWRSPWGPGRPGWHIECTAMAARLLGPCVDIHGGGADLLFPHHACSMAQAETASGQGPWVRFWLHTAMVRKDGQKMSKSLGNLVLAHDLMSRDEPDQLRLYLLAKHYRSPWEWQAADYRRAAAWVQTVHAAMTRPRGGREAMDPATYGPRFTAAMDEDLDTPTALEVVLALADDILSAPHGLDIAPAQDLLRALAGDVLGLWLRPYAEVGTAERDRARWPAPEIADPDGVYPLP